MCFLNLLISSQIFEGKKSKCFNFYYAYSERFKLKRSECKKNPCMTGGDLSPCWCKIIISLWRESGDQWESNLTLHEHLLQSQIINWFISPPLSSQLFRGPSEGVHYLFMESRIIQFAGSPMRSSVWMRGKGAQGQVNYSIICNVWEGKNCQGPGGINLTLQPLFLWKEQWG